jgi:Rrf2 family protein
MKISSRTRYGVRLMHSLAEKYNKGPIFLKDIAREQDISEKYLSQIVIPLKSAGLVHSNRGMYGGYLLAREPSKISLKEIVDVLEGETCLVTCVKDSSVCSRVSTCPTRDVWAILGEKISETLNSITLDRLVQMYHDKEQNIAMSNI